MSRLTRIQYLTYEELDLLATCQALLIYAIMAFYAPENANKNPIMDANTIINIQQITYRLAMSGHGVVTHAEKSHARPEWEEWIVVSAKRRVILAVYFFDCVFNTANDLPNFPADELEFLPAPGGKVLWQARSSEQWKPAYNMWLARWDAGAFTMGDLMKSPDGDQQAEDRLQMWLSEVDEFGLMVMLAVKGSKLTSAGI